MDSSRIYPREQYLERLRPFYDSTDLIKVVSGVRRCGKSSLMSTVADELRARSISDEQIIQIDLDSRPYRTVTSADKLDHLLRERIRPGSARTYLFIDEVQNVRNFEPVLNAWLREGNISIFVTGSNSYLLSGELVTKLTGRHIEIPMYPLAFDEYLGMQSFLGEPVPDTQRAFRTFIREGGFPGALLLSDTQARAQYIESVVAQILDKDVRARQKIRNREAFDKVSTYLINNFGATTSIPSIVEALEKYAGIRTKRETVKRYIDILQNARILERCQRFDLRSRRSIGAQDKYYLSDLGIYFARSTDDRINYGPVLENILYTYLQARGYSLSVGKIGNLECDFIARKGRSYAYVQVAMSISDPRVEEREYRPFRQIRDNYPQFLFTLDPLQQERDGVRHHNLMQFMASGGELITT